MTLAVLLSFLTYIVLIFAITAFTSRNKPAKTTGADDFFLAGRVAPWWVVAIGMIGDSISGVTFVSVPGMVRGVDMTYLQLCIGFFLGYIVVAYVLLPLYYRLGLTSIYTYLNLRYGGSAYRTGAVFFLISKMFGAAAKLYLVTMILQTFVFDAFGVPLPLTILGLVAIIWLYTRRGGMGTILWTDVLQTLVLVVALVVIIAQLMERIPLDSGEILRGVIDSPHHRIWETDILSKQHWLKQLISGAFIVIVMTGLDQNMMQKNLTIRTLPEAQKNMLTYGFCFIPLNYLFLLLGILLLTYASQLGIALPEQGDKILPLLVGSGDLGYVALVCFTLGITAASFSNADSALTALTTSVCVDLLGMKEQEAEGNTSRTIGWVHLGVCLCFALMVLLIGYWQSGSVLDTILMAVSYTYGPLLGLFAFGMLTHRAVKERWIPLIAVLSPLLSYALKILLSQLWSYQVGYEILLINGLLTILGLWLVRKPKSYQVFV